ncbi:MAG TPA: VWA domain-containing protein [Blastocatellia bacterium]|nr:VWA domain-containing protein [Blastocatellia bacterium]
MKTNAPTLVNGFSKILSGFACLAVLFSAQSLSIFPPSTTHAQSTSVRVESFPLKPEGEVRIENSRGATRIEVWSNPSVRVVAEKSPAGAALAQSEIVLMSAQNTVIIQCREAGQEGRIDLTVYVPRRSRVQVNGGIWPVEIDGALSSAVVETTRGKIDYRIPPNDSARIIMNSTRGVVRATLPIEVSERNGTRSLQGKLGSGISPVILTSQSGNITLARGSSDASSAPAASVADARSGNVYQDGPAQSDQSNQSAQSRDQQTHAGFPQSAPGGRGGSQGMPGSATIGSTGQSTSAKQESSGGRVLEEESASNQSMGAGARIHYPSNRNSGGGVLLSQNTTSDEENITQTGGPFARPRHEKKESAGSTGLSVRIIPADRPLGYGPNSDEQSQRQDDVNRHRGPARIDSGGSQGPRAWPDDEQDRPAGVNRPARPQYDGPPSTGRRDDAQDHINQDEPLPDQMIARSPRAGKPVLKRPDGSDAAADAGPERAGENEAGENEESIKLESSLVNLNVMVTNRSGLAFEDLKKEDLMISENGVRQEVDFFKPSTAPFNLVLLLDLSGSIMDKLDVIKSGALKFLDVIGPQDKVSVITFTDRVRVVSPLTSNRDLLRKQIRAIEKPEGGTAFYEAMWVSLNEVLRGTEGQRNAIVVMTDGVDSSLNRYDPVPSRVSFTALARRLEESDVIVFPIYLDTEFDEAFRGNFSGEAYVTARQQLNGVADLTGGVLFKAEDVRDLSGVYRQVAGALRTVYSVGYYSTNPERDGTFRRIRVNVSKPDAAVRTRKGYYAK